MPLSPLDCSIDLLHCRWQAMPPRVDTLAVARRWLEGLSVDGSGLHRDARGRPRLPAGAGDIGWSHSAGRLLMAYTPRGVIGVDVEASARSSRALPIARRYFARAEADALAALDDATRQQAFLRLWCAKEAVLKATGCGIAFGLHRIAFDAAGATPRMTQCDPALGNPDDWTVRQLAPETGFIAVIATSA